MKKTVLLSIVGLAAMIVNPFFACESESDPSFHYTEADMRAAIEGTWKLQLPARGATPAREITFTIREAKGTQRHADRGGLVRSASACSQRSFVRSAGACFDESDIQLDIRVAGAKRTNVSSGLMMVIGTEFQEAEFKMDVADLEVSGEVAPNGTVRKAEVGGGAAIAMVRVSRK